jgi:hypothetical protein
VRRYVVGDASVHDIGIVRAMQNRNDEPRLQHAPPRLPRKDGGRGRVNRRAMGVGEWRKVTSQNPAATSDSLNQSGGSNNLAVPRP